MRGAGPAPFHDTRGPLSRQGTSFRRASLSSRGLAPPCPSPLHPYPHPGMTPSDGCAGWLQLSGLGCRSCVSGSSMHRRVASASMQPRRADGPIASVWGRVLRQTAVGGWLPFLTGSCQPVHPCVHASIHRGDPWPSMRACVLARSVSPAPCHVETGGFLPC